MKIPKTIKSPIGKINIVEVSDILSDTDEYTFGRYFPALNRIIINKNSCQSMKQITLLHELLHMIDDNFLMGKLEESEIDTLAINLIQLLKNNKTLVNYLTDNNE